MIFGRPQDELIQLNEATLWSGGPVQPNVNPAAFAALGQTRQALAAGDYAAGVTWGGAAMRVRLKSDRFVYGYPKEGYPIWMDNVAILKTAPHMENARLFMNFIMDPENAALISAYARYANGIKGSEKYMPEDMRAAPEIVVPEEHLVHGRFSPACPQAVNDLYTKIWTEVLK